MSDIVDPCRGQVLAGSLFNEPMRVETVQPNGSASWTLGLVGVHSERFRKVTLSGDDLKHLSVLDSQHSFEGDGRLLRLGLQAHRREAAAEGLLLTDCVGLRHRETPGDALRRDGGRP